MTLSIGQNIGNKTITGIQSITSYGDFWKNENYIGRVRLVGTRKAVYIGWVRKNGSITNISNAKHYCPISEGLTELCGVTGKRMDIISQI